MVGKPLDKELTERRIFANIFKDPHDCYRPRVARVGSVALAVAAMDVLCQLLDEVDLREDVGAAHEVFPQQLDVVPVGVLDLLVLSICVDLD